MKVTKDTRYEIRGPRETFNDGTLVYDYSLEGAVTFGDSQPIAASFFFFDNRALAKKLFDYTMRVTDENVVRPLLCTYSNKLKRHILAVHAFHRFLELKDQLDYKQFSDTVSENPDQKIQDLIRGLLLGFKHIQLRGLSCSALHSRGSFVWVGDKLKILFVDVSFHEVRYHSQTTKMRNEIRSHLLNLSGGILNFLLRGKQVDDAYWYQRYYFIKSFEANLSLDNDVHLQMLLDHPFLEKDPLKILKMFFDADHALDSGDSLDYDPEILKELVEDSAFKKDIMIGGVWQVDFSLEFKMFISRQCGTKSTSAYDFNDMKHLLRCLRNLYCHYYQSPDLNDPWGSALLENIVNDVGFTAEAAHFEVKTNWPSLISTLHVKLSQSKKFLSERY